MKYDVAPAMHCVACRGTTLHPCSTGAATLWFSSTQPEMFRPPPWSHSKGGERQLWASEVWDHDLDETLAGKDGYLARSYIDADYVRVVNLVAG